jgi:hypothetical protein
MKKLPDFIIGGTQKSGTTFLYNLIKRHSNIEMPKRSMKHSFFDDDRVYENGINWYTTLFDGINKSDEIKIGQISADCSFNTGSIEKIYKHIPKVKLIFVLRHPLERTYSQYWFMYANAVENKNIREALKVEKDRVKKSYYDYKMYSYIGRSKYKEQFDNVHKYFSKDQVLIIPFENLVNSTLDTVNVAFDFLQINRVNDLNDLNVNSIPRNKAKLPINNFIVQLSFNLINIGLKRIGKKILNNYREEKKPPVIESDVKKWLENELKEDINYYHQIANDFNKITL